MHMTADNMSYCNYRYSNSISMAIFHLTRLFEASLDPLREPAQVTVTEQGVGTKSPRHTHN